MALTHTLRKTKSRPIKVDGKDVGRYAVLRIINRVIGIAISAVVIGILYLIFR